MSACPGLLFPAAAALSLDLKGSLLNPSLLFEPQELHVFLAKAAKRRDRSVGKVRGFSNGFWSFVGKRKGAEMWMKETEDRERLDLQRFGSIRS